MILNKFCIFWYYL